MILAVNVIKIIGDNAVQNQMKNTFVLFPVLIGIVMLSTMFIGCGMPKPSNVRAVQPSKVWRVQKGVASTPFYDGVCGELGSYIVQKAYK